MASVKERTGTAEAGAVVAVLWNEDGLTLDGLNALREPTPDSEVKQRPAGNTGIMLDYVDARFVMDRLDDCAGPQHWQTTYQDVVEGGVRCTLAIKVMGVWVSKTDVGDASTIEPIKGAHSDALKRAAVQWGIARDLYDNRAEASEARQRPSAAPQQAYRPSPVVGGLLAPQARPQAVVLDPSTSPWQCPIHHTVKVIPAGISRTTGRPYAAFYGCASKNDDGSYCNQKGPQAMPVQGQQVTADGQPLPF